MRVLIVGGAGYIGHHLSKFLHSKGVELSILDKQPAEIADSFYQGTAKDIDSLARAMKGCSAVYYLAWRSENSDSVREPYHLVKDNLLSLTNTLCTAVRLGIDKVIYSSSAAVYGNLISAIETDPLLPIDMYGALKLAGEDICKGFYSKGLDIVILRFSNVWGGYKSRSVLSHNLSYINGDGQQTRDFVHISDVVNALARSYDWGPGIYNISTNEETTINAVWSMIRNDDPIYKPIIKAEILRNSLDNTYTKEMTGWEPQILISEIGDINRLL